MSSSLFGDTMAPEIECVDVLLLGLVSYIKSIILQGSTTKRTPPIGPLTCVVVLWHTLKPCFNDIGSNDLREILELPIRISVDSFCRESPTQVALVV